MPRPVRYFNYRRGGHDHSDAKGIQVYTTTATLKLGGVFYSVDAKPGRLVLISEKIADNFVNKIKTRRDDLCYSIEGRANDLLAAKDRIHKLSEGLLSNSDKTRKGIFDLMDQISQNYKENRNRLVDLADSEHEEAVAFAITTTTTKMILKKGIWYRHGCGLWISWGSSKEIIEKPDPSKTTTRETTEIRMVADLVPDLWRGRIRKCLGI